jgi:hypothetical protein
MRAIEQVAKTRNKIRWSVSTPEDGHIGEAGAEKDKLGWLWWSTVWDAATKRDVTKEGRAVDEADALRKAAASVKAAAPKVAAKKPPKGKRCPCCGQVVK